MKKFLFPVIVCLVLPLFVGADWPQWRGPSFNGSTDEVDLPVKWSLTENIVWSADLSGAAAATPIVVGDYVFASTADMANQTLNAVCLDRRSGKLVWEHQVAGELRRDSRSNYASPSPASDGKLVVFFYGNGDLVTFDLDGKQLWKRNIQEDYGTFAFNWSFSTSPLLYNDLIYLQVLQRDVPVDGRGFTDRPNESYLLAIDPRTGATQWRQPRPCQAKLESREAFTTPTPYEYGGRAELLVVGGDDLSGHDLDTGEELWRWGTWNPGRITHWRLVPSPVAGQGIILACAPKQDPIYAVKAGGTGNLNDNALAWISRKSKVVTSDVPTPAYYDGDFFVLSDVRKHLSRVEPKTGKVKWKVRTPGLKKYEASPLAADGKIYLMNFVGTVVVVDAADGVVLNEISMQDPEDDPVRSSVVAAYGNLFIRTNTKLYCVGK